MAADRIRLCINSQTPPVRFKLSFLELLEKYGDLERPLDVSRLEEGIDYELTPGGVPAMIYPLLKRMRQDGFVADPIWISLSPNAPREVLLDGIRLFNVQMEPRDLSRYSNFKEGIWRQLHKVGDTRLELHEYEAYARYNWLCAQAMLELLEEIDLFFIHDFQQLQVGAFIGPPAPALLQWHTPFDLEQVSPGFRKFIVEGVAGFDGMIVSTKRDLEGLIHAGYHGRAYQLYPYIDPEAWKPPSSSEIEKVRTRLKIGEDDCVLLVVARMDPIKGQDLAIEAVAPFLKDEKMKLVLMGDGSFTGSAEGGLSHPKSQVWRLQLERLRRETRTPDSIVMPGYLNQEEVKAAYLLSDVVLVPSRREGFNLTVLEAWINKKPVIVSKGAGSSELVNDGVNGFAFAQGSVEDLRGKIEKLLKNGSEAEKMGANGFDTAKVCSIDRSLEALREIFTRTMQEAPGMIREMT